LGQGSGMVGVARRIAEEVLFPSAMAVASELAVRAVAAAVVHAGSRSIRLDQHAQRLAREATFLLVFASRPQVRAALLDRLAGPGSGSGPGSGQPGAR